MRTSLDGKLSRWEIPACTGQDYSVCSAGITSTGAPVDRTRVFGLGGFEVAEMIRERRPDTRIVFMSGYPDRDNKGGKMTDGAQFLQKPVKANRLALVIRMELDSTDLRLVG